MVQEEKILSDLIHKRNDAVEKLYDSYSSLLYGICLRYCGNQEDAMDVLQEGFIRIISHITTYKYSGKGSLIAWMKKIMINTSLNHLKKRKSFSVNGFDNNLIAQEDEDDNFFRSLQEEISMDVILTMIAALPPGYRTVFNLYVFENYSHREIAAELEFTENTSKSQLSKARAMLRKQISDYLDKKTYLYGKERKFTG